MRKITLIVGVLIAATGLSGCGGPTEKPADLPASKPISTTSGATQPASSAATSEESPTLAADEEMPAGDAKIDDGESPTEPAGTEKEVPEETAEKPVDSPASKVEGAINSVDLASEFENDKEAAESKYKDKPIIVEGTVGMYLAKTATSTSPARRRSERSSTASQDTGCGKNQIR